MKNIFLLLMSILSFNSYSQIEFEQGYFINDSDQKVDCLIKNLDWKNNPTEFTYKLTESSESQKTTINDVKEFGVPNTFKYKRAVVKIDRSSESVGKLSKQRNPIFNEEALFLKVLLEGKANLYFYSESGLRRFFYSKDNSIIEQLIYKKYKTKDNKLGLNYRFRQQLLNELKCNEKQGKGNKLKYQKSSLVKFFKQYNKCNNSEIVDFETTKRDLFNLTLRPRLYNSSLEVRNTLSAFKQTDFGAKSGFGFGVEAEFIMPFNKNKWAVIAEAKYQSFKATKTTDEEKVSGGKLISDVDYSSIEIPIGVRYYHFLNKDSKLFANISYVFDISSNSTFEYKRADNSSLDSLEIEFIRKLAFGLGYKFKDRYSMEIRYQKSRKNLGNYLFWKADYNTISLIFGFSLF